MKRFTFYLSISLLAFVIGLSVGWISNSKSETVLTKSTLTESELSEVPPVKTTPIEEESTTKTNLDELKILNDELKILNDNFQMKGSRLKVLSIAYEAFKVDKNIPPDKRKIENYRVFFTEEKNTFEVDFIALSVKENNKTLQPLRGGGGTDLGQDTTYFIDKRTLTIKGEINFSK